MSFLKLSKQRREEIENEKIRKEYLSKICKYSDKPISKIFELNSSKSYYGKDLPF